MAAFEASPDRRDPGGSSRPRPARPQPSSESEPERVVERSAGGVVVRVREERHLILLIRDPYRNWGLPKGHLEDGEGFAEAAVREVREETGLEELDLGPDLGEIDWTFRRSGRLIHKFCRFYLMASRSGEPRPQVSEGITECRWLPPAEALRTVTYGNAREVLKRGVDRLRPAPDGDAPLWNPK